MFSWHRTMFSVFTMRCTICFQAMHPGSGREVQWFTEANLYIAIKSSSQQIGSTCLSNSNWIYSYIISNFAHTKLLRLSCKLEKQGHDSVAKGKHFHINWQNAVHLKSLWNPRADFCTPAKMKTAKRLLGKSKLI